MRRTVAAVRGSWIVVPFDWSAWRSDPVSCRVLRPGAGRVPLGRHLDHLALAKNPLATAGRIFAEPMAKLLVLRRSGGRLEL